MSSRTVQVEESIQRAAKEYNLKVTNSLAAAQQYLTDRGITAGNPLLQLSNVASVIQHGCSALTGGTIPDCTADFRESQFNLDVREHMRLLSAALESDTAKEVVEAALSGGIIATYYATCRPEAYDLFSHLRVSEMMFIDGDSLLVYAFSTPHVDGDHVQTLHVSFVVLSLLQDLMERGANVHVVFFDAGEWIWSAAPQKRMARNLIRDLLLARSSQQGCPFVAASFPSFWGKAFAAHMATYKPEVFAVTDGETLEAPNAALEVYSSKPFRSAVEDAKVGEEAAEYFHTMAVWSVVQRAHAVFLPFERPHNNGIVAHTVRANSDRVAAYERVIDDAIAHLRRRIAARPMEPWEVAEVSEETMDVILAQGRSNRERATSLATAALLADPTTTPMDVALAKISLVAAFAAHRIDATLRTQPPTPSAELRAFLEKFAPLVGAAMATFSCGGRDWDALDGHFIAAIGRALRTEPLRRLASNDTCARVDAVWNAVAGKTFGGGNLSDAAVADAPEFPAPPPPASVGSVLTPVHPMIEQLAADFGVPPTARVEPTVGYGAAQRLGGWEVFNPLEKFDSVIDVDKEAAEKARCEAERHQQIKKERKEAIYVQQVQSTAASCGSISFLFRNEEQCIVDDRVDRQKKKEKTTAAAQQHGGTSSKGSRASANMKLDNFIRLCKLGLVQQFTRIKTNVEKGATLIRNQHASEKERREVIDAIVKFADTLRISESVGDSAPSRSNDSSSDSDDEDIDDAVRVWRAFAERKGEQAISDEKGYIMRHKGNGAEIYFDTISELEQFARENDAHHERESRLQHQITSLETKLKKKTKRSLDVSDREAAELEGLRGEHAALQQQIVLRESGERARRQVNLTFFRYFEAHGKMSVYLQVVKCLLHFWKLIKEDARHSGVPPPLTYAIELFVTVHKTYSLVETSRIRLTRDDRDILRSALRHLDFPTTYCTLVDTYDVRWEDIPPLHPLKAEDLPRHHALQHTAVSFQLQHMGHLLERPIIHKRDPRVPFNPDKWQRDLLDVVDRRGSAVVCAPTSAGKTFISYYCMKKVLRESNKDVIVYIAPTRALINQAVADVYARFGKKQYRNANCTVYGVLGGADFVRTPFNCQALVTLPEVFETVLLSPVHQEWLKSVKYVIFDEIHSLETSGNGAVWERLLAMVRAPFVALSATLGDHKQLCAWLNRVQKRMQHRFPNDDRCFDVTYIPNDGTKIQRWSDIQKYVYLPDEPKEAGEVLDPILHIHPMSCVTLEMLQTRFPQDLPFVPSECMQLYAQMESLSRGYRTESYADVDAVQEMDAALQKLDPERTFGSDRYITQEHARQWEQALKSELERWGKLSTPDGYSQLGYTLSPLTPEEIEVFTEDMRNLVAVLLKSYRAESTLREAAITQRAEEGRASYPDSMAFVLDNVLPALKNLQERGLGPTLIFAFEEGDCYSIVERLVEALEEQEARYRQTPEFMRYAADMALKKEEYERLKMRKDKGLDDGKKKVVGEDGSVQVQERSAEIEVDDSHSYDIPDVLPQFSFAASIAVERSTFESMTQKLNPTDVEYRALKRGIGIHHGGIRGKFRQAVERLFRMRYLPIVVATESLALGIHSPCRSVILAGDHMLLNTTQFRQMSGRAGRRGLDFLGHVVFLGVPMQKIQRLLTSDLMVLRGHILSDTVSQLRLLQLYNHGTYGAEGKSKKGQDWCEMIQPYAECMCVEPLFYIGRLRTSMEPLQVHLLRKTYVYFLQQGFLFGDRPSMLGSLATYVLNVFYNADTKTGGLTLTSLFAAVDFSHTDAETFLCVLAYCLSRHVRLDADLGVHRSLLRDAARNRRYLTALPPWSTLNARPNKIIANTKTNTNTANTTKTPSAPPSTAPLGGVLADLRGQAAVCLSSALREAARGLPPQVPTLPLQLRNAQGIPLVVIPWTERDAGRTEETEVKEEDAAETEKAAPPTDSPSAPPPAEAPVEAGLEAALGKTAVEVRTRSLFSALSGQGDAFDGLDDAMWNVREGLFVDPSWMPIMDFMDGRRSDGAQRLINACVRDFLRNGDVQVKGKYRRQALALNDGLNETVTWYTIDRAFKAIKNFARAIDTVKPAGTTEDPLPGLTAVLKMVQENEKALYDSQK